MKVGFERNGNFKRVDHNASRTDPFQKIGTFVTKVASGQKEFAENQVTGGQNVFGICPEGID
jgi:hypothetical protein